MNDLTTAALPAQAEFRLRITSLPRVCPWCHGSLDLGWCQPGFSMNGLLIRVVQHRRVGSRTYAWEHGPDGCHVPALDRIDVYTAAQKAGLLPLPV